MAERICPQCSRTYGSDIIYCPIDGARVVGDPSASLTGRVIEDRFTIRRLLAKGGMGSVYVALQHSMGREIALKMLRPEYSQSIDAVKRFMAEARLASRLTNPHTVSLFDFGRTSDGMLFIAMELLRGETLRSVLEREGPLPEDRVVAIAQQMCESLAEAHEAGLVHRDVKPDNVFLLNPGSPREFVKVLDFGVAKMVEPTAGETPITKTGMVCGTPDYMSPETVTGVGVCPASDVYSMGVLLYQLLTGSPPFRSDSLVGVMVHHVQTPPKPIRALMGGRPLSAGMESLVQRCLSKQASERPRDAGELQLELTRLQLEREEASVRRAARASVGLTPETTTAEQVQAVRGPERRRIVAIAAGVAVVAALVVALSFVRPDGSPGDAVAGATVGADSTGFGHVRPRAKATTPPPAGEPVVVAAPAEKSAVGVPAVAVPDPPPVAVAGTAAPRLPGEQLAPAAVADPAPSAPEIEEAPKAAIEAPVAVAAARVSPPKEAAPPARTDVMVRSSPTGAIVRVGARVLGATPVTVPVGPKGARVELRLDGYETVSARLRADRAERTFRLEPDAARALEKAALDGLK